jgi:hypothetical protein
LDNERIVLNKETLKSKSNIKYTKKFRGFSDKAYYKIFREFAKIKDRQALRVSRFMRQDARVQSKLDENKKAYTVVKIAKRSVPTDKTNRSEAKIWKTFKVDSRPFDPENAPRELKTLINKENNEQSRPTADYGTLFRAKSTYYTCKSKIEITYSGLEALKKQRQAYRLCGLSQPDGYFLKQPGVPGLLLESKKNTRRKSTTCTTTTTSNTSTTTTSNTSPNTNAINTGFVTTTTTTGGASLGTNAINTGFVTTPRTDGTGPDRTSLGRAEDTVDFTSLVAAFNGFANTTSMSRSSAGQAFFRPVSTRSNAVAITGEQLSRT